jgi:imidazolonepropionase-like amidohydrolase
MRFNFLIQAVLMAALMLFSGCPEKNEAGLALTGGLLIDGTGNPPVTDSLVLVSGGLIRYAGKADGVPIPRGFRRIDITGKTVLPGLINAHVHNAFNETNLKAWARVGVTTVRDLGGFNQTTDELFAFRNRVAGDNTNARLVMAGFFINTPGGYPVVPWGGRVIEVRSPGEAVSATNDLIGRGANVIKIATERGRLFGAKIPVMEGDTIRAICDTAHAGGLRVTVHVTAGEDIDLALDNGADELAHMVTDPLTDEQIGKAVTAGILWVPTLELWRLVNMSAVPVDNLRRFREAGGRIAFGTDYDGTTRTFEVFPLTEMRLMTRAGMTPMEIIVSATKTGAEACGMADELGTLEPGRIADILVVEGNPLEDVTLLENTALVVKSGEVIYSKVR